MMWCNVALTVAMPACRGGLILYRTQLPAGAVRNGGLLDVTAPVHDYAKVGQSSVTSWPRRGRLTRPLHGSKAFTIRAHLSWAI